MTDAVAQEAHPQVAAADQAVAVHAAALGLERVLGDRAAHGGALAAQHRAVHAAAGGLGGHAGAQPGALARERVAHHQLHVAVALAARRPCARRAGRCRRRRGRSEASWSRREGAGRGRVGGGGGQRGGPGVVDRRAQQRQRAVLVVHDLHQPRLLGPVGHGGGLDRPPVALPGAAGGARADAVHVRVARTGRPPRWRWRSGAAPRRRAGGSATSCAGRSRSPARPVHGPAASSGVEAISRRIGWWPNTTTSCLAALALRSSPRSHWYWGSSRLPSAPPLGPVPSETVSSEMKRSPGFGRPRVVGGGAGRGARSGPGPRTRTRARRPGCRRRRCA